MLTNLLLAIKICWLAISTVGGRLYGGSGGGVDSGNSGTMGPSGKRPCMQPFGGRSICPPARRGELSALSATAAENVRLCSDGRGLSEAQGDVWLPELAQPAHASFDEGRKVESSSSS